MTSTVPAACAGALATIVVGDSTVTAVEGTVPNCTAVAPERSAPVMVTADPPVVSPAAGLMPLTVTGLESAPASVGAFD